MIVKVLIENSTSDENFVSEHGLSLYIEEKGKKYLLDAGQSGAFIENAAKMDVDLANVEFAVLSHGHYDHAGGFGAFLERCPEKKIYALDTAKYKYYSTFGGTLHEIGISENVYPVYEKNLCFVGGGMKLTECIYLIPHSATAPFITGTREICPLRNDGNPADLKPCCTPLQWSGQSILTVWELHPHIFEV